MNILGCVSLFGDEHLTFQMYLDLAENIPFVLLCTEYEVIICLWLTYGVLANARLGQIYSSHQTVCTLPYCTISWNTIILPMPQVLSYCNFGNIGNVWLQLVHKISVERNTISFHHRHMHAQAHTQRLLLPTSDTSQIQSWHSPPMFDVTDSLTNFVRERWGQSTKCDVNGKSGTWFAACQHILLGFPLFADVSNRTYRNICWFE